MFQSAPSQPSSNTRLAKRSLIIKKTFESANMKILWNDFAKEDALCVSDSWVGYQVLLPYHLIAPMDSGKIQAGFLSNHPFRLRRDASKTAAPVASSNKELGAGTAPAAIGFPGSSS